MTGDTYSQTLTAIQDLANRYAGDTDVVTAIELLNEPAGWDLDLDTMKQFYYSGWGNIRNANTYTAVVIHDAFQSLNYWDGFMTSGFNDVILDTHIYQIFSDDQVAMKPCEHVQNACSNSAPLSGSDLWTIVGEVCYLDLIMCSSNRERKIAWIPRILSFYFFSFSFSLFYLDSRLLELIPHVSSTN